MFGLLPEWLSRALISGEYGVTFFFVLSGFILTYNYLHWFRNSVDETRVWSFFRLCLARNDP
jgi:peptidoglycan/LPS O-acetylase OafA/YrhL